MTAALLLIIVLPFVQILIQRLRRQSDEKRVKTSVQTASLHNVTTAKKVNNFNNLNSDERVWRGLNDFRGLS